MFLKTLRFLILLFVLGCCKLQAQNGELDHFDCLYAKEVVVPFKAVDFTPILDQTVFYSYRDQFSYWYRINVKADATLSFKVSPINDSDSYAVYVYQYNGDDFCKNVFLQKAKPVKSSFFDSYIPGSGGPFDLSEKRFRALNNNTYYICVLNTSPNNCGHRLRLLDGKDTLRVNAIHMPCKRDLSALAVTPPITKKAPVIKDSLPAPTPTLAIVQPTIENTPPVENKPQAFTCYVKDSEKKTAVDGRLGIMDAVTGEEIAAEHNGKGVYTCTLESGRQYRIKSTAFGYQASDKVYTAQGQQLDVLMEPLKEGANFIMRSIYFYPNTYALKKESSDELQKLLSFLSEHETVSIEIQGHTNGDNRIYKNKSYEGMGEEWNFQGSAKKLSQKRAEAIKQYLESNGIAADRLVATGFGGEKPIIKDPETMEEGQRNIRVEVVILKK